MSIKYAILGLLQFKEMHGYRIKKLIERDFGFMWTVNYGQIYPALKSMLEDKWVTMSVEAKSNSPDRKLYSITEKGRQEFLSWLGAEPERRLFVRDPFLLRFTFFDLGDKVRALEMIDGQIEFYETQLALRKAFTAERQRRDIYVRLATELGIRFNEMFLDWLRHARGEIEQHGDARTLRAVNLDGD
ncbi:MAG: PadR family transcriptional regulator [Candidatus Lernaella stagnicola]|nr:PadR family transcriptional regulator [Candidatus Lernaella stagnicola]